MATFAAATGDTKDFAGSVNHFNNDYVRVTTPDAAAENDLLLVGIFINGNVSITTPDGWTLIGSDIDPTSGMPLRAYWRRHDGASSTYTFTGSDIAAKYGIVTCAAYTGVPTEGTPFAAVGLGANVGDGTNRDLPTLSLAHGQTYVALASCSQSIPGITAVGSGMTERANPISEANGSGIIGDITWTSSSAAFTGTCVGPSSASPAAIAVVIGERPPVPSPLHRLRGASNASATSLLESVASNPRPERT